MVRAGSARLHRPGNNEELLTGFHDFCKVDFGLAEVTAKEYRRKMRRFFRVINKPASSITAEDVRGYLKPLSSGSPNTYGNALKPLKRFFRDYMKMGDIVGSFKFHRNVVNVLHRLVESGLYKARADIVLSALRICVPFQEMWKTEMHDATKS